VFEINVNDFYILCYVQLFFCMIGHFRENQEVWF